MLGSSGLSPLKRPLESVQEPPQKSSNLGQRVAPGAASFPSNDAGALDLTHLAGVGAAGLGSGAVLGRALSTRLEGSGLPDLSALASPTLGSGLGGGGLGFSGVGTLDMTKLSSGGGGSQRSASSGLLGSSLLSGTSGAKGATGTSMSYSQLLTAASQLVSAQQNLGNIEEVKTTKGPAAFDREALRRLAQEANASPASAQFEPPPLQVSRPHVPFPPEVSIAPASAAATPRMSMPLQPQDSLLGKILQQDVAAVAVPSIPTASVISPVARAELGKSPGVLKSELAPAPARTSRPQLLPGSQPPPAPQPPPDMSALQRTPAKAAVPTPEAPFAASAGPAVKETNKNDASSVFGIMQQAQDNVARAGASSASSPGPYGQGSKQSGAPGLPASSQRGTGAALAGQWGFILGRLESAAVSSEHRRSVEKEVRGLLPQLDPNLVVELMVRCHATDSLRRPKFLDDLTEVLVPLVPKLKSPDLTRLTLTFANWASSDGEPKLSNELRNFFGAISTEVSLRLMDVTPGDLARIASCLASLGLGGIRLFASLARAAVARTDRFQPHELVALVGAFDKARLFQTALFEALARSLKANIKEVAPKDVMRGMRSLAMCGIRDEDLGQVIGEHLPTKASKGLSAEEFSTLAWTFCALDLHHGHLFRALFQTLEETAVVASETLCQLYEIHLTLKAFHHDSYKAYELEEDTVRSLRDHYKKHRGGSGRYIKVERTSERIHSEMADVLRAMMKDASISTAHQTSMGFIVDIAATKKKSSSRTPYVFLDVDGPHSIVRSLDPTDGAALGNKTRVRGATALKRRTLQKNGFKVAVISEEVWRAQDDHVQKLALVRKLLLDIGIKEADLT